MGENAKYAVAEPKLSSFLNKDMDLDKSQMSFKSKNSKTTKGSRKGFARGSTLNFHPKMDRAMSVTVDSLPHFGGS